MSAGAPAPRAGLRERKKARTRAAIQEHALRLFRAHGYDATTVEQIIEAAEVSQSTFFRYFPTKDDVVLQDDLDAVLVESYRAQPAGTPPARALRAALRSVLGELAPEERRAQRWRIALILSVPELRGRTFDQLFKAIELLAEVIAERAGRDRADVGARTIAGALVGALMTVFLVMADDPDADVGTLADQAVAQLEAGLVLQPR